MPDSILPYAADADSPLSASELNVLRKQYQNESRRGEVTAQTKFNYAWGLIKSRRATEIELGIKLFIEIYRETPERRRECLYYLALGNFRLGNYRDARIYNDKLMDLEPKNLQAQSLKDLVEEKLKSEGLLGMMITGGVVVSAIGALMVYFKNSRKQ